MRKILMNVRIILVLMEESVPKGAPEISTVDARSVIMGPSVRYRHIFFMIFTFILNKTLVNGCNYIY